jgi:hypothetical protein
LLLQPLNNINALIFFTHSFLKSEGSLTQRCACQFSSYPSYLLASGQAYDTPKIVNDPSWNSFQDQHAHN